MQSSMFAAYASAETTYTASQFALVTHGIDLPKQEETTCSFVCSFVSLLVFSGEQCI